MNKKNNLTKEERELLQSFEKGRLRRIKNFAAEKKLLEDAARATLNKDKRINIRISSLDLERVKKRAVREGMPYQTLISSLIHKLCSGKIQETA